MRFIPSQRLAGEAFYGVPAGRDAQYMMQDLQEMRFEKPPSFSPKAPPPPESIRNHPKYHPMIYQNIFEREVLSPGTSSPRLEFPYGGGIS
jgi:hypothetical protein